MEAVAIVLDGDQKSALAAVRSLGKAGVHVIVGATRSSGMATRSRYVAKRFTYPEPKSSKASFLAAINTQIEHWYKKTGQPVVLLCFSDATHVTLVESINIFSGKVSFPLPSSDSFKVAFDKRKTAALADRIGIQTIPTLDVLESSKYQYPVVIKPARSISWRHEKGIFKTAEFVFDADTLTKKFNFLKEQTGDAPIVQKIIKGEEYGVELLCKDGNVFMQFAHQRIRSLSPTGGAAVVKQTAPMFHLTEKMVSDSIKLAEALVWTGPIMIEWKVDHETDKAYLMEINGRFWGSLPLAVMAGADFPLAYYQLATGVQVSGAQNFVPLNIRSRHLLGDIKCLFKVLFDRSRIRFLLYPTRNRALVHFFIDFFNAKGDVWSWKDPLPAVFELIDVLRR